MWPNNAAALGWMPWVILSMARAGEKGSSSIFPAIFISATQLLAGAPELTFLTWVLALGEVMRHILEQAPGACSGRENNRTGPAGRGGIDPDAIASVF